MVLNLNFRTALSSTELKDFRWRSGLGVRWGQTIHMCIDEMKMSEGLNFVIEIHIKDLQMASL